MKPIPIVLLALGIVLILLAFFIAHYINNQKEEKVIGDCYDNHNNKINGVTCEVSSTNYLHAIYMNSIFFVFISGIVVIMFGITKIFEENEK